MTANSEPTPPLLPDSKLREMRDACQKQIGACIQSGAVVKYPNKKFVELLTVFVFVIEELLTTRRPSPLPSVGGMTGEMLLAARQVVFDFEIDGLRLSSSIPILREKLIPFNGPEDNQRTLKLPPESP